MFEPLESRRLSSATPVAVSLDQGVLRITGSDSDDTLSVTENGSATFEVAQQIDGNYVVLASIPESMVSHVVIEGRGGDDFLVLQTAGSVSGDVFGGNGNDEIHIEDDGVAASTAYGDNDDDLLVIFRGNGTQAFGGNGCDRLISLDASNTTYLFGDNGSDNLTGTLSTVINGGNGNNTVSVIG